MLRRSLLPRALPALAALLAACGDAPTLPTSFVQQAGGRTWVAVTEPRGLPDARSWLPFLAPADAQRVHALQGEAGVARRAGELERALQLEAQSRRFAAGALRVAPPAARLDALAGSLREWERRAAQRAAGGAYPALDSVRAWVASERAVAEDEAARGDPVVAAAHLAEAAEGARSFAPEVVAVRVLAAVEQRVGAEPDPSPELRRALMLLRLAREAMASGDQTRAMRRAWYALQLIDADQAQRAQPRGGG